MAKRATERNLPANTFSMNAISDAVSKIALPKASASFRRTSDNVASKFVSVEQLENRKLFASDLGINVNAVNAENYGNIVATLRAADVKAVRLWYGFNSYQDREIRPVIRYATKFHNDGFQVTLAVNPEKGRHGTADETRAFFENLVTAPGVTEAVDIWELGNEPDSEYYWKGTLPEFVSDFVAPAARVLHNFDETVASGGVSWNPKDVKEMVDVGLLNHVDLVGIHPYSRSVGALKNQISETKSYVGGTPLIATEWNVRGHERSENKKQWAKDIAAFWPVIREGFAVSHYFVTTVMDSLAGPAGILTRNFRANEPFYSTFMSLQDDILGGGEDPTEPTDPTPTEPTEPTPPSEPTKPTTPPDPEPDTGSSDGDGDSGTGNGGSTDGGSSGGNNGGGTDNHSDGDDDASGGSGSGTDNGGRPTRPSRPTKPSTDGDDDASDGVGNEDGGSVTPTPSRPRPSRPTTPRPSRPTTPQRPTTGTVTPDGSDGSDIVTINPPAISSFSLINAARDRIVQSYAVVSGVTTIDLASTGTEFLSLLASGNKKTASVVWTINGQQIIDSDGTFTLFGEKKGDLVGAFLEAGRKYTITAQAYTGEGATGVAGAMNILQLNVVNTNPNAAVTSRTVAEQEARRRQAERDSRVNSPAVIPGL